MTSTDLMRNNLKALIAPTDKLSGSLNSSHAGLMMQRGLAIWDSGENKECKKNLIERVSQIQSSELYKKAYNRWVETTSTKENCAFTTAKIVGRLYTGMSSATALETGLTTQHTYGMPMLAGSSVKGSVVAYAKKLFENMPDKGKSFCKILFGDDDNTAGAVIWHDAWWIPNSGKPFVGEIVTTHHQDYYNGKQELPDEMESPIPNQQIACQGSFYFVVEGVNPAWADFARDLLLQTLQEQGVGSKTASGYGYFEFDEEKFNEIQKDKNEKLKQQADAQKQAELDVLPEHERLIAKWLDVINGTKKYSNSDSDGTKLYEELKIALNDAITHFSPEQQKGIAEKLAFKSILQKGQPKWFEGKREKEIRAILTKLRGE